MTTSIAERARELTDSRRPFVHATVVRAQEPTSAQAGDDAVILADGSIEGFVGGVCTESSVRAAALNTLRDGNSLLLRVLPESSDAFPETPGALVVVNPCHSGGALEIFLRPVLPRPLIGVAGATPIAGAVAELAGFLDFEVTQEALGFSAPSGGPGAGGTLLPGFSAPSGGPGAGGSTAGYAGAIAVVVAGLGRDEERQIRAALDAGVPFVALVSGRRRGAEVLDGMGLTDQERARVHPHAGIDIGARTPKEIALAVLAQIVQAVRSGGLTPAPPPVRDTPAPRGPGSSAPFGGPGAGNDAAPRGPGSSAPSGGPGAGNDTAVDPVCGMTVVVGPETPHARVDGQDHWFCCTRCLEAFTA